MRMPSITLLVAGAAVAASTATAQAVRVPSARAFTSILEQVDPDRAMLGVTTATSGNRDTLGLLVESVVPGSPAEKAGIEEGNRLVSINGVSLKLSRDDAADEYMQGINQNRLTREMRKVKAGDEVALEVYGGGRTRAVRVKTVAAETLEPQRKTAMATRRANDHAVLGVTLSATGTRRDTAGVFVQQVSAGGPAETAGIIEGDRIASINGVDVRVAREDAGDQRAATARIDRLQREVAKLKAGDVAELVVVSGGRSRTVRVTTAKASELHGAGGFSFEFGPDVTLPRFSGPDGIFERIERIGTPGSRRVIVTPGDRQVIGTPGERRVIVTPGDRRVIVTPKAVPTVTLGTGRRIIL